MERLTRDEFKENLRFEQVEVISASDHEMALKRTFEFLQRCREGQIFFRTVERVRWKGRLVTNAELLQLFAAAYARRGVVVRNQLKRNNLITGPCGCIAPFYFNYYEVTQ